MTREDYELIAAALNGAKPFSTVATPELRECHTDICASVADALARDNPRFNRELFLEACGAEG